MAARLCAKRAHQLAASVLANGVGPSRLPAASACNCRSPSASRSTATHRINLLSQSFSTSAYLRDESPQSASVTDAEPQHSSKKPNVGLLAGEDTNAEPTLEYLDSLKPRARRLQREQHRPKRVTVNPFAKSSPTKNSVEDKQWERTRARINASFTRGQLVSLGKAARLPGSYARTVKKEDLVRRIMVHRFGMEDARERTEREKREELDKRSVHIAFRPAELYLLLSRGYNKVRQEASKAQVAILPQAPAKEKAQNSGDATASAEKLGFWIRGKDPGIARMTDWVEEFKQSIKTKEDTVVLSNDSRDVNASEVGVTEVLPAELVRYISQLSRCFMEASPIQGSKVTLSLAFLDERDAQKAVLLLRQYHAEGAKAMHRIGAAACSDDLHSSRQYSMLPFVPNEPTPWIKQADDLLYGSHSDVSFRVSHVPELNAFSMLSTTKLPTMKFNAWSTQDKLSFEEPFRSLAENAATSTASNGMSLSAEASEVECSAELGHVLFDAGGLTLADENLSEEDIVSRVQDPLAAPISGSWSLETAVDWTRRFRARFGREASRFVPTTLFRSQKNISLDIWLERQGYVLASNQPDALAGEHETLVYQPSDAGYLAQVSKLEITLVRNQSESDVAEGASGGWRIRQARWVLEAQADVLIPEKGSDLRLSARHIVPLEAEILADVERGLASYLDPSGAAVAAEVTMENIGISEDEAAGVDSDDILGSETEVVERSSLSTAKALPKGRVTSHKGALRPSVLELGSVGKMALETVTRSSVQTYVQRSALSAAPHARPGTSSEVQAATDDDAGTHPVDSTEQLSASSEADAVAATPITTAEVEAVKAEDAAQFTAEHSAPTEGAPATSTSLSPVLIREISQDCMTEITTESLRISWRLPASSEQSVPEWSSVVEPISALLERHDMSTR
ncbi:hypothetical protein PHSY_006941 [Pseudozyma hubeiensis SY62]|uniref:Uncharacterized protein n=1 Tax=Pseudozyma hubeiensis (strain SY62) TaxID=1305764 RepID=R9PMN1_PSEHS|nr:hypothetical protein PHSY_006941 [Pseudozyma hubeiensis SY62]GAC99340.1 hypothetical protein PHSY_006941 [Pseudozyma hubeiensis SY62]